ncbi:MAG TPA: YoaK family protein [Bryobacteraceae bacterium]|nr:YoaK family protein [Bryobacteraceae bacterium]
MQPSTRFLVSILLTWAAGYVDAVGWLTWQHIYTANMSGNSVGIGISAASADWARAALRAWPVLMYVLGLILCRALVEIAGRRKRPHIAWLTFAIEVGLLLGVMVREPGAVAGIALLALAMGIQNATLTKFGAMTLHTGFVTGTLVKFAEQFSAFLFWVFDHGGGLRAWAAQRQFRYSAWLVSVWIAYVIGAVLGAVADHRWAVAALAAPVVLLAGLAAYDLRYPLALADEIEQLRV